MTTLVWFRHDLRLSDNPALSAAVRRGGPVVPVFIWAPDEEGVWPPGAASRWWLQHSLESLAQRLTARGSRLILRSGDSLKQISLLIEQTQADAVYWNDRHEPAAVQRDGHVETALFRRGVQVRRFNAGLLFDAARLKTSGGRPYQVFTPFWRACLSQLPPTLPQPAPKKIPGPVHWPASEPLKEFQLLPSVGWAKGFTPCWTPGEPGAQSRLKSFLSRIARYPEARDIPSETGTSRLSPHLHFGEISPRQVWAAVQKRALIRTAASPVRGVEIFLREIGWREFASYLLIHFPYTAERPLRPAFGKFPWRSADSPNFDAWKKGRTGFPLVDAGLRELWRTGWMHNRVRMIVASFLVKDLRISWLDGARWFWDTLVDADLANNTLGWQWAAGCGADAAPYFRIFNPARQAEKFDPDQSYVKRWIPELATRGAYPAPVVDHAAARLAALQAFSSISQRRVGSPVPSKSRKEVGRSKAPK